MPLRFLTAMQALLLAPAQMQLWNLFSLKKENILLWAIRLPMLP